MPSLWVHTGGGRASGKGSRQLIERIVAATSQTRGARLVYPNSAWIAPGLSFESAGWGRHHGIAPQFVSINAVRCAMDADRPEGFLAALESAVALAVDAHLQKLRFLEEVAPPDLASELSAALRAARMPVVVAGLEPAARRFDVERTRHQSRSPLTTDEVTGRLEAWLEDHSSRRWTRFGLSDPPSSLAERWFWPRNLDRYGAERLGALGLGEVRPLEADGSGGPPGAGD